MSGWIETTDAAWLAPESGAARGVVVWLADGVLGLPLPEAPWLAAFAEQGLALAVVRHPDPWWTDRSGVTDPAAIDSEAAETAESRVVRVAQSASEQHGPIALAGEGTGGHGALRIAYRHPREFPVAAAWRPAIDCHTLLDRWAPPAVPVSAETLRQLRQRYDADPERARQDSATLHIHPLNWPRNQRFDCPPSDPWWEGCDRLRMKLSSLGVPHDADLETDPGEEAAARRLAGWIKQRLEQEARRVP